MPTMSYLGCLDVLAKHRTDEVVVAGMTALLYWGTRSRSDRDILYTDPMGTLHAMGLGIALARPDVGVWVLNGDGSLLMNLGGLATIAGLAPPNLAHFVFNNGVYALTGLDAIPASDTVDFSSVARGCGWTKTYDPESFEALDRLMPRIKSEPGPHFVTLRVDSPVHSGSPEFTGLMRAEATATRFGRFGVARVRAALASARPGKD